MANNKLKIILKSGIMVLIFIIIALLHLIDRYFTKSKAQTNTFAKEFSLNTKRIAFAEDSLFTVYSTMDTSKETLFFIHGAPGSWDAFAIYLNDSLIRKKYNVVSYDRPGYAQSKKIKQYENFDVQAQSVATVIEKFKLKKVHFITHSYGGPIGLYASSLYPNEIKSIVLLSPVIDPYHEKMFWYSYVAIWPWTRWILPHSFRAAGAEKKIHAIELNRVVEHFKNVSCPILMMHSLDDNLAPGAENISFIKNLYPSTQVKTIQYDDKGHMFMMFQKDLVINELITFFENKSTP